MSLDRPTRSVRLIYTDRTSEDRLGDNRRSSHETKICMVMYIQPLSRVNLLLIMRRHSFAIRVSKIFNF